MTIVYVVTSGEYSDYGINAIFSTKELADNFVSEFNKTENCTANVEEWELDIEKDRTAESYWYAVINIRDGGISGHHLGIHLDGYYTVDSPTLSKDETYVSVFSNKSQEHANKLAIEKRQAYLRELGEIP